MLPLLMVEMKSPFLGCSSAFLYIHVIQQVFQSFLVTGNSGVALDAEQLQRINSIL